MSNLETILDHSKVYGKNDPFTHVSQLRKSKYYVDNRIFSKFWDEYCSYVQDGKNKGFLAERPRAYFPLRVDIDFKSQLSVGIKRQYTDFHVKTMIGFYQSEIEKIVRSVSKKKIFYCLLLEKSGPRESGGYVKDGFHLHFPYFILDQVSLQYLTKRVKSRIEKSSVFDDIECVNNKKDMVDDISTKCWLLYGSVKSEESETYKMTYIFDNKQNMGYTLEQLYKLGELKFKDNNPMFSLPKFLSIHGYIETEELKENIRMIMMNKPRNSSNRTLKKRKRKIKTDRTLSNDLATCTELIPYLSLERAVDRNMWMDVGWTLFSIGEGTMEFFELWCDFSKKDSSSFSRDVCMSEWNRMKNGRKTISSLIYLCKHDSPGKYITWTNHNVEYLINRILLSFDGKVPTEGPVSDLILFLYKNVYFCDDPKRGSATWYSFGHHIWESSAQPHDLKRDLYKSVSILFRDYKEELKIAHNAEQDEEEKELYMQKMEKCNLSAIALERTGYHNNLVNFCKIEFRKRQKFIENLDSERYLLGTSSGVFEILSGKMRDGLPEDYITMECGVDYEIPTPSEIKMFEDYFCKTFPEKGTRQFIIDIFACATTGLNIHKKAIFFTGKSGDNGKSLFVSIVDQALGDYSEIAEYLTFCMNKNADGAHASPNKYKIRNRRVVIVNEIPPTAKLDFTEIKKLTGADKVSMRPLFGPPITTAPKYTLIFQTNDIPDIPTDDQAFINRFIAIPCNTVFNSEAPRSVKEQKRLHHYFPDREIDLKKEMYAKVFLYKILNRYREIHRLELFIPETIKVNSIKNVYATNYIQQFVDSCVDITNNQEDSIPEREFRNKYTRWFKSEITGVSSMNSRSYDYILHKCFDKDRFVKKGRKNVISGIKMNDQFDEVMSSQSGPILM